MTTRDRMLVLRAIENCENRERKFYEDIVERHPADKDRQERILNNFLFAAMMVRYEIERMIEQDEAKTRA